MLPRLIFLIALGCFCIAACGHKPYRGYKYKSYTIRGTRYYPLQPREAINYKEIGIASYYHEGNLIFPGKTALGESFRPWHRSAAHKTLPLPCKVEVTNLENGRRMTVRINDRGPYIRGRILDVSPSVAKKLGFHRQGLAKVRIRVLSIGDGRYRIAQR